MDYVGLERINVCFGLVVKSRQSSLTPLPSPHTETSLQGPEDEEDDEGWSYFTCLRCVSVFVSQSSPRCSCLQACEAKC